MREVKEVAGEHELQDKEPRQEEGVHNHPVQGEEAGGRDGGTRRRICYSTILPETMGKSGV